MEEKKLGVDINNGPKIKESQEKLTYEQLNEACMNLSQQNQQMQKYIQDMHKQMRQMDIALQTRRMDYLFKVVELEDSIKDVEFVNSCIAEIKEALTVEPEEEPNKN